MRALVVSSHDGLTDQVERRLLDADVDVVHCHAPGEPSFPCSGLAGGDCPLDSAARIDVAVDVRGQPVSRPTIRELAPMLCALRLGIPVVVTGRTLFHPFEQWGAFSCDDQREVVKACFAAAGTSASSRVGTNGPDSTLNP